MNPSDLVNPGFRTSQLMLRTADFDVAWVGESPEFGVLCLGSDDGQYKLAAMVPPFEEMEPVRVVESEEAINGVAFSRGRMAVSTRNEVVVVEPMEGSDGLARPTTLRQGAHGVIATGRGRFIAPMGPGGLLLVDEPTEQYEGITTKTLHVDLPLNYYRAEYLGATAGGADVIACAVRDDGFLTATIGQSGNPGGATLCSISDLDVVDLCSLGSPEVPFGLAVLGLDRSIILSRDVLSDRIPLHLNLDAWKGVAYRVLSLRGDLVVLTSEALYVVPGLVAKFIAGSLSAGPVTSLVINLQAVDIYPAFGRLFVVLVDRVIALDSLGDTAGPSFTTTSDRIVFAPNGHANFVPFHGFTLAHAS